MPRLPRWAWVLVAVVLAIIAAAYVGVSMMSKQPAMMKSAPAPAKEREPQPPGSKRFGGGVIRGVPGDSREAE